MGTRGPAWRVGVLVNRVVGLLSVMQMTTPMQLSRFCEAARGPCNLWDIQWVVPLFNFRDLQLRGDAASGICNLWDVQFSFCDLRLLGYATSGIFNGWSRDIWLPGYAPRGIFNGCPAVQLLRSSTAGICLWDIQWVAPLINFCDLQLLGCATS